MPLAPTGQDVAVPQQQQQQMMQGQPMMQQQQISAWDQYCMASEVRPDVRNDLQEAVGNSKVVLLLDDSGSMQTQVKPPGQMNQFAAAQSVTRWSQLQTDVAEIVQLVFALKPQEGCDIHFMNRGSLLNVTNVAQLAQIFAAPPTGGTPMIGSLNRMYATYGNIPQRLLLILITDGEPSDGEYPALFRCLTNKPGNCYVSMVECNDNEEEMDYLTGWDQQIARFHNQEDYGEELRLVRQVNGPNTKFTRANYVQMILLSPIYPKYAIDIRRAGGKWGVGGMQNTYTNQQYGNNQYNNQYSNQQYGTQTYIQQPIMQQYVPQQQQPMIMMTQPQLSPQPLIQLSQPVQLTPQTAPTATMYAPPASSTTAPTRGPPAANQQACCVML